jgi:hypothetical protein
MSIAQAFHSIKDSLTEEQAKKAGAVFCTEMAKQGVQVKTEKSGKE